ncbi:MAG: metalloregulator ArsR/SmtB family transcription factor [Candidatus Tectomicrobia bacterium]|nr:metalloregulator ArsR/SmtB family transcription factor [Candidatus Tectomicrobia bacterium]
MDLHHALAAFTALAQEHRLQVFRLLMRQAPYGLPAGQLSDCLGIPASTLSAHLAQLERAGLLRSWREQRRIFYAADTQGIGNLLTFLTEECCNGHPDLCGYESQETPPHLETPSKGELIEKERLPMSENRVFHVLFLCTGNSARSITAECILNDLGHGKFRAYSAGSHPKGEIHPYALDLLQNYRYATDHLRSKSWEEFTGPDAPPLDFVFTLCDEMAKESCPVWPGQPVMAHWGLPDPAAAEGTEATQRFAFIDTMRMLTQRIDIFVNLPVVKLDPLSLRQRVDAIGKTTPQESHA